MRKKKTNQQNYPWHTTGPNYNIRDTENIWFYEYKYDENEANLMLPHI